MTKQFEEAAVVFSVVVGDSSGYLCVAALPVDIGGPSCGSIRLQHLVLLVIDCAWARCMPRRSCRFLAAMGRAVGERRGCWGASWGCCGGIRCSDYSMASGVGGIALGATADTAGPDAEYAPASG